MHDHTAPDGPPTCIVVVEDDDGVRRSLQLLLQGRGYEVRSFADAQSVLCSEHALRAGVLLADYRLPDGDGLEILRAFKGAGWQGRSILMTAYLDDALTGSARALGFDQVIGKPIRRHELVIALARCS